MIAFYGLPGSRFFAFRRVATLAEGERWLNERSQPETRESLRDRRASLVVSDTVAMKMRWQNGLRILQEHAFFESTTDKIRISA